MRTRVLSSQRARAALVVLGCVSELLACDAISAPPEMATPDERPGSTRTPVPPPAAIASSGSSSAPRGSAGMAAMAPPPPSELPPGTGAAPAPGIADAGVTTPAAAGHPGGGCLLGTARVTSCPLPASQCASETTLVFFENARCEDGGCTADPRPMRCPNGSCSSGSCMVNLTLL
jgi:hypothetical protein